MRILRFEKRLAEAAGVPATAGTRLRHFAGPADVGPWLRLRTAAFAGMTAAGREWTVDDFDREFASKPWWTANSMWLAEMVDSGTVVGSVALGRTGRPPNDRPCVQWLMVAPEYRRRGIGAALLAAAEQAARAQGEAIFTLETHADWREAVRLYEAAGWVRSVTRS